MNKNAVIAVVLLVTLAGAFFINQQSTACPRYLGKEPCMSAQIDASCFKEVKF